MDTGVGDNYTEIVRNRNISTKKVEVDKWTKVMRRRSEKKVGVGEVGGKCRNGEMNLVKIIVVVKKRLGEKYGM